VPEAPPGRDVLLEIEVDGAQQIKALYPDALLIVVMPPTIEEQERRLRGRGDPDDRVRDRVAKAAEELAAAYAMNAHEVVNDDLDRAVADIEAIIRGAREAQGSRP